MPDLLRLNGHRTYLLGVAARTLPHQLRPKAGCSDLVQETLLAAWVCRDRAPDSEAALRSWLRGILRNRIGRLHRRYVTASRRSVRMEQSLGALDSSSEAGTADSVEGPVLRGELAATVDRAVARLRPRERDILAWRLNDGLPWHEIADRLQVTADAARKALARALSRLRGHLPRHLDPGLP
jgi:RNA polymerase sigma-70 factor, ECF subfamily